MSYTKRIFLKYILGACISCFMALQGHATVRNGADQLEKLLPLLEEKRVSLVVNQTSLCGKTHLLDTLVSLEKIADHGIFVFEYIETWNKKEKTNIDGFYLKPNVIVLKHHKQHINEGLYTNALSHCKHTDINKLFQEYFLYIS